METHNQNKRILIVTPYLQGLGGVANYYKAILPLLKDGPFSIDHFDLGSAKGKHKLLHPVTDQINFHRKIQSGYELVHLNPSLNLI